MIILNYGLTIHFNQEAEVFFFCFIIMSTCHDLFRITLPTISMLLADEVQFAHKPDQVEFQLDRSQLLYLEHLGLVPQEAAQPSTTIVPQEAAQQNTKKKSTTIVEFQFKELHQKLEKKENLNLKFFSLEFGPLRLKLPLGKQLDLTPS